MKKIQTLCYVFDGERLLLGLKKRGFGAGRWNGFGGKLLPGETVEQATRRELKEEAGLTADDLTHRGVLEFTFENDPDTLEGHVFSVSKFSGEPIETDEMKPQWFDIKEIPYDRMWPDDEHWLPLLLAGKNFRGEFYFKNEKEIIDYKIEEA